MKQSLYLVKWNSIILTLNQWGYLITNRLKSVKRLLVGISYKQNMSSINVYLYTRKHYRISQFNAYLLILITIKYVMICYRNHINLLRLDVIFQYIYIKRERAILYC